MRDDLIEEINRLEGYVEKWKNDYLDNQDLNRLYKEYEDRKPWLLEEFGEMYDLELIKYNQIEHEARLQALNDRYEILCDLIDRKRQRITSRFLGLRGNLDSEVRSFLEPYLKTGMYVDFIPIKY